MKFLSFIFFIATFSNIYAQQSPSQWKFPTNIVELCKNLENSIISTYRHEIEANRATINTQLSAAERNDAYAISDAAKKAKRVHEDSWHKLNCTHLLYKK